MVDIGPAETKWTDNPVTMTRGTPADITTVATYHAADPTWRPSTPADISGPGKLIADNTDPLWDGKVAVAVRLGARVETGVVNLAPGDYQRWVRVSTADEDIIVPTDTVTQK